MLSGEEGDWLSDVFISHADEDADWSGVFARRLEGNEGGPVFIRNRHPEARKIGKAVDCSANAFLVPNPTPVTGPWATEEYSALYWKSYS